MNTKISQFDEQAQLDPTDIIPFVRLIADSSGQKNKIIEVANFNLTSLNNIDDVDISSPNAGESLIYGNDGKWRNAPVSVSNTDVLAVHSANPANGDGSFANPFNSIDNLLIYLDANPSIAGYTILFLGGTYTTAKNMYRGCSFYFFPGTYITYTGTKYLIEQEEVNANINRNYASPTLNIVGDLSFVSTTGGFCNLGMHRVGGFGKNYYIDINSVSCIVSSSATDISVFRLYGNINSFAITLNYATIRGNSSTRVNLVEGLDHPNTRASVANSGCGLSFLVIKGYCSVDSYATLLKTAIGNCEGFSRNIVKVDINNLAFNNSEYINSDGSSIPSSAEAGINRLFDGSYNADRPAGIYFSGNNYSLINRRGGNFINITQNAGQGDTPRRDINFVFKNIVFKEQIVYPGQNVNSLITSNSYAHYHFSGCVRSAVWQTKIGSQEYAKDLAGNLIDMTGVAAYSLATNNLLCGL